jgi:hypothetical protein
MPTEIRSDDAALRPSRLNAICDPFWIRGPKDGCFAFQLFEDYGSTNSHNLLYHGTTYAVPHCTAAEYRCRGPSCLHRRNQCDRIDLAR